MTPPINCHKFLGGRILIKHYAEGFRSGMDAVLMAAAVPAKAGERVLELGSFTGVASLSLAARVSGCHVTGVELQEPMYRLACENAIDNTLQDHVNFVNGDLREATSTWQKGSFNHVMANPPYWRSDMVNMAWHEGKTLETVEMHGELKDWVDNAVRLVKKGGTITYIYRTERTDELIALLRPTCGNITLYPLWSLPPHEKRRSDAPIQKRMIIQATKGSTAAFRVLPGMIMHRAGERHTEEALAVTMRGEGIVMG